MFGEGAKEFGLISVDEMASRAAKDEEILDALRHGCSAEEFRQVLGNWPEEDEVVEVDEVATTVNREELCFEYFSRQRGYFDAAFKRAILTVGDLFYPNPYDYHTAIELAYLQEVAASFCTVTDPYGSQLGKTVDEIAKRCVDAEAGSRKQSQLIEDLQAEIEDLKERVRGHGTGIGR